MSRVFNRERKISRALPRVIALALALVLAFAVLAPGAFAVMPTRGDLVRFIPVAISVDTENTVVYGSITNLNPDCYVSNFRDFGLAVFVDGKLIASGYFGTLESFSIGPDECMYYTLIFPGNNNLYPGTYICSDDDYAILSCTFDYSELTYKSNGVK